MKSSLVLSGLILLGNVVVLAGCAPQVKPPDSELSKAELAVERAGRTKAVEYAPVELEKSREKLSAAQQAYANENYDRAQRLASEALVDAQLAETKAAAAISVAAAEELQAAVDTLRKQANPRPTSGQ